MIPLLLATSLSCTDAQEIIQSIKRQRDISDEDKVELVEVVKVNSDKGCWDAND